mmetsp:Transcript_57904/g.181892  ORF Transcript_57904/g.181892 Transcript_57904/m.181892 type:complete len:221 (-) Transcript_57904:872-1534(-)
MGAPWHCHVSGASHARSCPGPPAGPLLPWWHRRPAAGRLRPAPGGSGGVRGPARRARTSSSPATHCSAAAFYPGPRPWAAAAAAQAGAARRSRHWSQCRPRAPQPRWPTPAFCRRRWCPLCWFRNRRVLQPRHAHRIRRCSPAPVGVVPPRLRKLKSRTLVGAVLAEVHPPSGRAATQRAPPRRAAPPRAPAPPLLCRGRRGQLLGPGRAAAAARRRRNS